MIITVFILLFSVNFAIYFLLLTRRWKDVLASDELRFFGAVVCIATLLITLNILPLYESVWESLRYAVFQVASIISTTGFGTADFVLWPHFSQMILVLLMFCGACAGSTGGGMKCSRILLLFRSMRREIHHIIHPRSVEVIKLDGKAVDERTLHSTLLFVGGYLLAILAATLVVSLDSFSFSVSAT
jgi:trk system potassium uptake protein TrkH